ncbi:hypothetical protein LTS18_009380, partial [Coniosporium uncinatum]
MVGKKSTAVTDESAVKVVTHMPSPSSIFQIFTDLSLPAVANILPGLSGAQAPPSIIRECPFGFDAKLS